MSDGYKPAKVLNCERVISKLDKKRKYRKFVVIYKNTNVLKLCAFLAKPKYFSHGKTTVLVIFYNG